MTPGNASYLDHIVRWLVALIVLSLGYELYRATVMAGTSPHDSLGETALLVPPYALGIWFGWRVRRGERWALWAVLVYCVLILAISLLHYNPVVMAARNPGVIDWFEDLAFTSMVLVTAYLTTNALRGVNLVVTPA
jgi:hypothetical protein